MESYEPKPGDIYRSGEREIWVQFIQNGEVFFGPVEGDRCILGGSRMPIAEFIEGLKSSNAELATEAVPKERS